MVSPEKSNDVKAKVVTEVQATDVVKDQGGATAEFVDVSDDEKEEELVGGAVIEKGSLSNYLLARDRARRDIVRPVRYTEEGSFAFALTVEDISTEEVALAFAFAAAEVIKVDEPQSYAEAREISEWEFWNRACFEEKDSLDRNKTWILVPRPKDRQVISCRWLFKLKPGIKESEPPRYKARLVARGFTQREGIDYHEVFAPVVKHVSIRTLLSVVVNLDLELEQMDVKTAFLHGELEEDLNMTQPEGFEDKKHPDYVCLLKKSLYGLKQSPRQWNKKFDQVMRSQGFIRSEHDSCVYTRELSEGNYIYLLLYVDDMLIAAKDISEVKYLKSQLSSMFEMKDLGPARRILGMDIVRDREKEILYLSQSEYLKK